MQALRAPADAARAGVRPAACRRSRARAGSLSVRASADGAESEAFDPRAFRRQLGQSGNYSRKHMRDEDAAKAMEEAGVGAVSAGVLVCFSCSLRAWRTLTALTHAQAASLRR